MQKDDVLESDGEVTNNMGGKESKAFPISSEEAMKRGLLSKVRF